MGIKKRKPQTGYSPSTIIFEEDGATKLVGYIKFSGGSGIAEDPMQVELRLEPISGRVKVFEHGMQELDASGKVFLHPEVISRLPLKPPKPVSKPKEKCIFPCSIAYLSSLPDERCGISTYTQYLSEAVGKHYHVGTYRNIRAGVPEDGLIHSQCEFGIFPNEGDLLSDVYANNPKVVTWHTVIKNPHPHHLQYCQAIDQEYDAHIVHTVLGKKWLSGYVSNPVYLIPHGTLLWNPLPKEEARKKLGLPTDAEIGFCFGFGAETKGFGEVVYVARRLERRPKFLLIISGAVHPIVREHGEKVLKQLRANAGKNVLVLGKYISERDVNLYASACDVLIFNYRTPSYISSASGALKRVLAAGKPIVGPYDNRLDELVDGYHILKFQRGDLDDFEQTLELVLSDHEVAERLRRNCRALAEQTSWERIAEKHMEVYGKVVGDAFSPEYYDRAYFDVGADDPGKIYRTSGGEVKRWGYVESSTKNWLGWIEVVKGLRQVLRPRKILDVGSGVGGFVHFARKAGLDARGCDFSPYAVEHAFRTARGHLDLADVRDLPYEDNSYDLVLCLDLMEHLYEEDLPRAISELRRVSSKYIFYNIGTTMQEDEGEFVLKRGQLPPKEMLATSIAGHCNVRTESYWRKALSSDKWRLRDDLVEEFRRVVPEPVLLNWRTILILTERVE